MTINSYSQIYAIGHRAIRDILFMGPVLVEEKIDGSQFSFSMQDGELHFRSKGAVVNPVDPPAMFAAAVEYINSIAAKLHEGWTYRGEVLSKSKHNALAYDRVPNHNIIIFDICIGDEMYVDWPTKNIEAYKLGLETVPILYFGEITDVETLKGFLERDSVLGGVKIEGFVVKNYGQFAPDKKVAMGKFVSEAYKEVHDKRWKESNPSQVSFVQQLGEKYRSEARWQKAVQHLAELDQLEGSPKDIGVLLKEIPDDILKEEQEAIMQKLFDHFWPQMRRVSTAGFPEWYKEQLLEGAL